MLTRALTLLAATASLAHAAPAEHVILVSIDGWAHHYFDDPKCHMPAVKALAANGVRAKRMECSFPTVTWTNHTTLVTGVHPGKHGVLANAYFDRAQRKKIPLIPDPLFNKDEIVKTPTIYDAAKAAGLKTAAVIWPASRGAKTLDWTVPDVFEQELFEKYGTPSLLEEARAAGIPIEKQMEWCKAGNAGKAQRDYMYAQLATHIIKKHKPNFLAIHLVSLDSFEHAHGRQVAEAYWAANDSDNRVADLIRAAEEAGIRDKTTFVITTDHGFVTYTKSINANSALKKDGFVKTMLGKSLAPDSQVFAMAEGGACFVYVLDTANRESILQQITPKLARLEGVSGVVEAKDFDSKLHHLTADKDGREPDLVLLAGDGYTFTDSLADNEVIIPNDPPKGAHGHFQLDSNLYGNCVISGAGVKPGGEIDEMKNIDVTPTMAKLLGIPFPGADGRVLEEALK
ncbi:MAG: alkaline phosphatase family protein [Prosthecobacter sp.]|jgi:predicted AlkP superfamily pyrophosphatase or phosphodiesterase|uniref:alkaline phosphatase family protein n=1 Tax=Prosthecobacter sp. TaxID=1965333 RepID=UPI001A0A9BAC|nr:alkaline phosphatase family protein [Prosthecobacter sp.]MBE2282692.1 alkaline phosphatase family protein [Prosthecobacter sp.]